jgi:hypothetical protein
MRAKVAEARTPAEALGWLTREERLALLADHEAFHALTALGESAAEVAEPVVLRSA